MTFSKKITFDAFVLDAENELLWMGPERIHLRPKTFAFLRTLAERSGQLLTKTDLLNAVWNDCNVGDEALKHCVAEIRRALGDNAETPVFIETVHRRGYRFLQQTNIQLTTDSVHAAESTEDAGKTSIPEKYSLAGRNAELTKLHQLLTKATKGMRQVVFIAGDQGIGKTSLIDVFLETLNPDEYVLSRNDARQVFPWIARGQCIKSHGAAEAYMPLMEAFTGLGRHTARKHLVTLLQRHAPLWLVQMPSLVTSAQLRKLQRVTVGATGERMMREMADALDAVSAAHTMILVLEDLQWSDHSTLDLISYWAQRRAPSRLLLIATYRPADAALNGNPLKTIKQELQEHGQCQEIVLPFLGESAIREYLQRRFPGHKFPKEITSWIHQRTGGNPLFLVHVLDHLIAHEVIALHNCRWTFAGSLTEAAPMIPPTVHQIIERQLEHCSLQEQRILKTAAIEGNEFSAAGIAAVLGKTVEEINTVLHALGKRHQFLQIADTYSKSNSRYRFIHSLYQTICYQLLPEELRISYHRKIAKHIERIHRKNPVKMAAQLAMHYDHGQQPEKALDYFQKASENANSRFAGHEALDLASRGLELLQAVPDNPLLLEQELLLQNALGIALMSTQGAGIEEVRLTFSRAHELFHKLSIRRQADCREILFSSLYGLWCHHWHHAEYTKSYNLAAQLLDLAKAERNAFMQDQAHYTSACVFMDHGEYSRALDHFKQSVNTLSGCLASLAEWMLGYPEQALKTINQSLALAIRTGNPEHHLLADLCKARIHMERREYSQSLEFAQKSLDLASERKLSEPLFIPIRCHMAWALSKLGQKHNGLEQMNQVLSLARRLGTSNLISLHLCMFAELCLDMGHFQEGLAAVNEALEIVGRNGMNHYDAELYRMKGELLFRQRLQEKIRIPSDPRFEEIILNLEQAVTIARQQQAKSLELRAVLSLTPVLLKQNRHAEARQRLQAIYNQFTEGFQTADLQQACALLQRLS
jgi:predicted ATPase/DNA-binding winged helix-turn-helix (wHTH) protein